MSETLNLGAGNWGVKDGSLLGYNSENGNFKPLPFNFERSTGATRVNEQGLIENVPSGMPRIDFSNDANGALLLEPQRSNLVTYSEDFSNSYWTKSGSSVVSGFTSPKGDASAFKLVESVLNEQHRLYVTSPINIASGNVTKSFFVKNAGRSKISIYDYAWGESWATFNLTNGSVIDTGGVGFINSKIELMTNGFYKISMSFTPHAGGNTRMGYHILDDSYTSGTPSGHTYQGDGTSGVYIYGAQLEQGSYATSYIPTQGSAVTRVADVCNGAGNSQVFNDSEGVLYLEISTKDTSIVPAISISDGTAANSIEFAFYGTNQWNYIHRSSAGTTSYVSTVTNASEINKFAFVWTNSVMKSFLNGVKLDERAVAGVLSGLDDLSFTIYNGTLNYFGNVKDLRVYNTVLTDTQLQQLTS